MNAPRPEGAHTDVLAALQTEHVFRRFRVTVSSGADQGLFHEAASSLLTIGTAEGNLLRLRDPTVSRHHATIEAAAGRYVLRDAGSTNGIVLQGCRVETVVLRPGVSVSLGSTTLRFECLGDDVREELSAEEQFDRVLGRSVSMRRIFALLPKLAASNATVLLEGETGTGKSMLAEVIHKRSPRADKPFIVIDCSAIPPTLIESELFGHERGSFTGALQTRIGAFESAEGGTVFLDEIGELPLAMQPKLLRALEEREVRRVGGNDRIPIDVRVVSATHHDLKREVNQGSFRADLFFRINVVALRVPALRERPDDIVLLLRHFYEQMRGEGPPEPPGELVASLSRRSFPGNVRELRAAVERAILLGSAFEDPAEGDDDAGPGRGVDFTIPFRAAKDLAIGRWEASYLRELMRAHRGNLSHAARAVRADRSHLRELLRRHGLSAKDDT